MLIITYNVVLVITTIYESVCAKYWQSIIYLLKLVKKFNIHFKFINMFVIFDTHNKKDLAMVCFS